jgi:hypothetical protein
VLRWGGVAHDDPLPVWALVHPVVAEYVQVQPVRVAAESTSSSCRSYAPESSRSAKTSCSSPGVRQPEVTIAVRTGSMSDLGSTSHDNRSAGASVLLAVTKYGLRLSRDQRGQATLPQARGPP